MTDQFTYIARLAANGFKFPEFESERHERHIYTHLTGSIILLDANGVKFDKNEDGVIDGLVAKAQESWKSFRPLVNQLQAA